MGSKDAVSPLTDLFLRFVFQNNAFIIQWITLAILLVLIFWSLSSYLHERDFEAKRRKEVLEGKKGEESLAFESFRSSQNQYSYPQGLGTEWPGTRRDQQGGDKSGEFQDSIEERKNSEIAKVIDELRSELNLKNSKVQNLQEKLDRVSESSQSSEQLAKMRELENRLAEYKIIEKDLANLSIYKMEVKELRAQLAERERSS